MKKNDGIVSMEACIVLPIFFFLMLFLYGFILMFWVQNEMTHALIQATEKLAVEPYFHDCVQNSDNANSAIWLLLEESAYGVFGATYKGSDYHNAYGVGGWYEGEFMEDYLGDVIGNYVAEYLDTAHWEYEVVDSIDEFNVSNIYYDVDVEDLDGNGIDDKLTITMHYTYEFLFDFQGTVKKDVAISSSVKLLRAE